MPFFIDRGKAEVKNTICFSLHRTPCMKKKTSVAGSKRTAQLQKPEAI